jgi:NAD(P)-dependent dehydrogenase (short-subunit alcohol dehydrogenase family)
MAGAPTLAGKHALVTGGGTGIGAAIALALAQADALVTICGRRVEELQASAQRHDNIHAQAADVTDADALQRLYRDAQAARGDFSIVVANAGVAESAPAEKISRALWDQTIAVNLTGAFLSVQPALAAMRERQWGRIVFIASTAALKGYAYVAPYVAAKHGVIGLTKTAALEYADVGIRVNAVCPGFIKTRMTEDTMQRRGEAILAQTPAKRMGNPEEIAEMVVWLSSDRASFVTGSAYTVDGGWTAV